MEPIEHNEDLKKIILDMTQKEFRGSTSNKGILRYIEGKVNSVIDESISEFNDEDLSVQTYIKTLKRGAYQQNISDISKVIKGEELFKSKSELIKFAKYLGININVKQSYKLLLKKVSNNIYENKDYYNKKYIYYTKENSTYVLEPEKIKNCVFLDVLLQMCSIYIALPIKNIKVRTITMSKIIEKNFIKILLKICVH